ncbi:MAG: SpaH/EbpB family LPXTG-anchored major pilin [Varibaculum cambriense]|uniref:SpaH/EbpB family LPXTG-anchored major pilin n=1 Tax=Varibaculum cambriense TaxID=184870 RepID=UPI001ED41C40|nr:SpaH/EbpB family LPXTG-anchored major pilin [Varibaculum cambriense]MBS5919123.1 SpaH/EbpB family LPXTG-anchored major pilin [Varibaculum cambriense]
MSKKKLLAVLTGMVMAFMGLAGVGAASAAIAEWNSLTVHKYLGATSSLPHNGTKLTEEQLKGLTSQKPLQGVKFKLYQVEGVDVNTNEGVAVASKIGNMTLPGDVVDKGIEVDSKKYTLKAANPAEMTTDAQGQAVFTVPNVGLVNGVYVVVEDLAGSGDLKTADGAVDKAKVTPAAPFAVSVPMTSPDGTTLNKDVHVYPKNQVNDLTKTVKDAGKNVGDDIVYTISTTSTGADTNGDGKMDKADLGGVYEIVDTLDPNLTYKSVTVKVAGAAVTEGENGFTLTKEQTGNPAQDKVTVSFKGTTLDTIAAGAKVEVTFTVKLNSVPSDGLTKNTGQLFPNKWSKDNGKPVVSPEVVTKHGDIVIKKVNKDGGALKGAEFDVYLDNSVNKDCSEYGDKIVASGATDEKGLVSIKGLHLTNFVDNKEVPEADQHPYCLVETKAPSGYQLLPKPVKFSLTKAGAVADLTTAAEGDGSLVKITNYKNPGLPLTGAQGILLVSVLGLILVSVGVVLTVKRRQD